jgi:hypothetical protein
MLSISGSTLAGLELVYETEDGMPRIFSKFVQADFKVLSLVIKSHGLSIAYIPRFIICNHPSVNPLSSSINKTSF